MGMTTPTGEPGTLPNVHQAIAKAMLLVHPVGKLGRNKQEGYAFKKIDDFMTAANEAMAEAGVHQVPRVLQRIVDDTHTTSRNNVMRWVDLEVEFRFYGPAGDYVECVTWGEARDASDKATNKALTAAQKYALMYVLMVPTSDIQDADQDSPESGETQQAGGQTEGRPMVTSEVRQLQERILEIAEQKKLSRDEIIAEFDAWKTKRGMALVATIGNSNAVTLQAFVAHLLASEPPEIPGQDELPLESQPEGPDTGEPAADPPQDDIDTRLARARERNEKHQ